MYLDFTKTSLGRPAKVKQLLRKHATLASTNLQLGNFPVSQFLFWLRVSGLNGTCSRRHWRRCGWRRRYRREDDRRLVSADETALSVVIGRGGGDVSAAPALRWLATCVFGVALA